VSDGRVTIAELAAELGVSDATVRNEATVCGIGNFRGPYTPAEADTIRATRRDRLARIMQRALADELGVAPATVSRRARQLGFGTGPGYTPAQAEALRRSFAAMPPQARRRGQG
jgi:DNA-binding MurR/RpiR family transcriptional regulator